LQPATARRQAACPSRVPLLALTTDR
jgi:hypothetical protein